MRERGRFFCAFPGGASPCRGRFHGARRRVSEAKDRKARLLRPEISARPAAAQGLAGRSRLFPANDGKWAGQNGRLRPSGRTQGGMPSSRRVRGGINVCGRIWNPPLQPTGKAQALRRRSKMPGAFAPGILLALSMERNPVMSGGISPARGGLRGRSSSGSASCGRGCRSDRS